jgi:hypothetical protein
MIVFDAVVSIAAPFPPGREAVGGGRLRMREIVRESRVGGGNTPGPGRNPLKATTGISGASTRTRGAFRLVLFPSWSGTGNPVAIVSSSHGIGRGRRCDRPEAPFPEKTPEGAPVPAVRTETSRRRRGIISTKGRTRCGVTLRGDGIAFPRIPAACTQYAIVGTLLSLRIFQDLSAEKRRGGLRPGGGSFYLPGRDDPGASGSGFLWQDRHDVGTPSLSWQAAHSDMEGNPGGPFEPWQAGQATPAPAWVPWENTTFR